MATPSYANSNQTRFLYASCVSPEVQKQDKYLNIQKIRVNLYDFKFGQSLYSLLRFYLGIDEVAKPLHFYWENVEFSIIH
jgi:hypothetical protein